MKSPHYLLSAPTAGSRGSKGTRLPLPGALSASTRLDSTSHCKAAFDRDLCLLVVLLIKMHFYCFTLSLYISSSLPLFFALYLCFYLPLLPSAALNIELVESLSTFAFFFAHFPGCRYIRFPISTIYISIAFLGTVLLAASARKKRNQKNK